MNTAKLTLFFNDSDGSPQVDNGLYRRDLDPDTAPFLDDDGNAMWVIGRGKHAHIAFDSIAVSRRHAYLRCWAVESRSVWQIKHDLNARNPSWKDNRDGVIRLPDQWLNIHDYDQFWFAAPENGFICTTSPNDTMQCESETDVLDDGPPTVNETMEKAIADAHAQQLQIDNVWEGIYYALKEIPNTRLAIYAIATVATIIAVEWIRSQGN